MQHPPFIEFLGDRMSAPFLVDEVFKRGKDVNSLKRPVARSKSCPSREYPISSGFTAG
jgi:hypothetical protein